MGNSDELTAKGFIRKLVGFSMASWLSAGISFLVTPAFTRLYLPEEAGRINLFTTYSVFFQTICVLALDQAFMRFYNENLDGLRKNSFLRVCLGINFRLVFLSSLLILAGYRYVSRQISGDTNSLIPICLTMVIAGSTFLRMNSICARMEKNVRQYTCQVLFIAFVEKILVTFVALKYPNHRAAVIAMTTGYVLLSTGFLFIKRRLIFCTVKIPKKTIKILMRFSIPYVPVLLLSWLNSSIPLFVLKRYLDYASIGIYTNAITMANILTIIQTGFSAYWEPFIFEHYKDIESKGKIRKIERTVIFILITTAVLIILFQDIIYLLIGEKFRPGKLFFPFLMFTPICNLIADMTGVGIKLSQKSYLNIYSFIVNTGVNAVISCVLVPRIGVLGAGLAVCLSSMAMLAVRSYFGGKYYKICEDNRFILFAIGIMFGACIVNVLFSNQIMIKSVILILFLCIQTGVFRKEIRYLVGMVRNELSMLFLKIKSG